MHHVPFGPRFSRPRFSHPTRTVLATTIGVLVLLVGLLYVGQEPVAAQADPQTVNIVTLAGRTDGWVQVGTTRNWVSSSCRGELMAEGATLNIVSWPTLAALTDAVPFQRCPELIADLIDQGRVRIVTLAGRSDGWVQVGATRNWVSSSCRADLVSRGAVLRFVSWPTLSALSDAVPFQRCPALIADLFPAMGPATDLDGALASIQTAWGTGGPAVIARQGNSTMVELQPTNDEGWWQHHWEFEAVNAAAGVYRIKNRSTHPSGESYLSRSGNGSTPINDVYLAPFREQTAQRWTVTVEDMGTWKRYRMTSAWAASSSTLTIPGYQDANGVWQRGNDVAVDVDYGNNSQRFLLTPVGSGGGGIDTGQKPSWLGNVALAGLSEPTPINAVHVNCSSGNDAAAGTQNAPWRSLGRVGTQPFGTDVVIAGTCVGQRLNIGWSGSAANPVIVTGAGTGANRPALRANRNQVGNEIVNVTGNHVQIWDLRLEGSATGTYPCSGGPAKTGYLVGVYVQGDDVTVARVDASGFYAGVYVADSAQDALVTHSELHHNDIMTIPDDGIRDDDDDAGSMGVLVWGDDAEISWNWFSHNRGCSPDYGQDGASIEIFNGAGTWAHNNHSWQDHTFAELGEGPGGATANNTFDRNYFYSDLNTTTNDVFLITRWGGGQNFGNIENTVARNNRIVILGASGLGFSCGVCNPEALSLGGNDITAPTDFALDGGTYQSVPALPGGTGPGS